MKSALAPQLRMLNFYMDISARSLTFCNSLVILSVPGKERYVAGSHSPTFVFWFYFFAFFHPLLKLNFSILCFSTLRSSCLSRVSTTGQRRVCGVRHPLFLWLFFGFSFSPFSFHFFIFQLCAHLGFPQLGKERYVGGSCS